jgi:hypothetical protein
VSARWQNQAERDHRGGDDPGSQGGDRLFARSEGQCARGYKSQLLNDQWREPQEYSADDGSMDPPWPRNARVEHRVLVDDARPILQHPRVIKNAEADVDRGSDPQHLQSLPVIYIK